jgi:hypothetical protein
MRHIIPISGKDSLATALVQMECEPTLPYEFIYNDVQAELPETYAWLDKVAAQTGWNIHRIGLDLTARIRYRGGFLPSGRARYCTREGKIEPMQEYLGFKNPTLGVVVAAPKVIKEHPEVADTVKAIITPKPEPCTIYYGLRADEQRTGYVPLSGSTITPKYPLIERGIGLAGVYEILDRYDLAPPSFFWPRLYEAVKAKMDVVLPGWEQKLSRMEHDVLFAGRTRANCYFCFFQRQYEYIWLMETHPDLWEQAKAFECVGSDYTWRDGYALKDLEEPERALKIFNARVLWVCGQIAKKLQLNLFDELQDNEIAGTSCGLMCGK